MTKKKITSKSIAYGAMGLTILSSSILISSVTSNIQSNHVTRASSSNITSNTKYFDGEIIRPRGLPYTIRSNPTNGFNGLKTHDGKYTYVLITKGNNVLPDKVGGTNSGIACIENDTAQVISEWYLPSDDVNSMGLNYTTNIVFGQTPDGKFDESKLFVLCGISNLAGAINRVYTGYDSDKHILTTNIKNAPSIKIFSLTVNNGNIDKGDGSFYNFAYPSDGTNGYAGFNAKGYIYDMQSANDSFDSALYFASGIKFNNISRKDNFQEIDDTAVGAFGSFLTYLTYGQNFAYHAGYSDEFIMTSSFVNVDENIGGLYSATVTNGEAQNGEWRSLYAIPAWSEISSQLNWPVPFGYQWLLASIAHDNIDKTSGVQYQYIDARGQPIQVNWGNALALNHPIIAFLDDHIFPDSKIKYTSSLENNYTDLFSTLFITPSARFGANWGQTTGYIIFTPSKLVNQNVDFNLNDYRYYYVIETVLRDLNNNKNTYQNYSNYLFTNLLVTDQLALDGSLSYLIGFAWCNNIYVDTPGENATPINPSSTLFTPSISAMVCYDWNSISNDNAYNALIQPLNNQLNSKSVKFGGLTDYYQLKNNQTPNYNDSLKKSFDNWNLVFLGGQSGNKDMDTIFSIDSAYSGYADFSFLYAMSQSWYSPLVYGVILTYLRKKISFAVHTTKGYVFNGFTTQISYREGYGVWNVRQPSWPMYIGFLAVPPQRGWSHPNPICAIDEVDKQPYGNGGWSLVFTTTNGIYTIGDTNDNPNYKASAFELIIDSGNSNRDHLLYPAQYYLLAALGHTSWDNNFISEGKENSYVAFPNATIVNHNMLCLWKPTAELYSIQINTDYTVLNCIPESDLVTLGRGRWAFEDLWRNTPAAKPALKIDNNSSVNAQNIHPVIGSSKDTSTWKKREEIIKDSFTDVLHNVLGLSNDPSSTLTYTINDNYSPKNGAITKIVFNSTDSIDIMIPVTYQDHSNIIYYAPVINGDQVWSWYQLRGLQSSDWAEVLIILNAMNDLRLYLTVNKITEKIFMDKYGAETYNQATADEFNTHFVNTSATNNYLFNKHGNYFQKDQFTYWLIPAKNDAGVVTLTLKYKMFSDDPTWTDGGLICDTDYYDANTGSSSQAEKFFILPLYHDPSEGPTVIIKEVSKPNVGMIVGIVMAFVIVIATVLSITIWLMLRKQRRINMLNARISSLNTNRLPGSRKMLNSQKMLSDKLNKKKIANPPINKTPTKTVIKSPTQPIIKSITHSKKTTKVNNIHSAKIPTPPRRSTKNNIRKTKSKK